MGNSVLSNGGTGNGIYTNGVNYGGLLINNLVEGFSGIGGIGIDYSTGASPGGVLGNNMAFQCATPFANPTTPTAHRLTDTTLTLTSPFAKTGADTFANRATYFAPVDTSTVIGGAYQ